MRKSTSVLLGLFLFGSVLTGCSDKDLYHPSEGDGDNTELNPDFKFELRTEKQISIAALNADGKAAEGVLFGVYTRNPYEGDGNIKIEPFFTGYTDASGNLNAAIPVAGNIAKIYAAPLSAGYAGVKEIDVQPSMSCSFAATPFPVAGTTRSGISVGELGFTKISLSLYQLFTPYTDAQVDNFCVPLQGASPLVSKETLSPSFLNLINSWYPEEQNVQTADLGKSSDIVITDENGAEVWATYVGDGGFSETNPDVYNVLVYYNYTEGKLTSRSDTYTMRMTELLPNTHAGKCPAGLKVQLLYWNGQEYGTVFPKGTRIGFGVSRDGLRKTSNGAVTSTGSYSFKNTASPKVNGDVSGFYYSTPILNGTGKTNAVIRTAKDFNCCIMGFDIRPNGDSKSDYDFNDVLIKLTASPVKAMKPEEDIPVIEEVTPSESVYGTLAFEDQWPQKGDYDFNDFVMNYTYGMERDEKNRITGVKLIFEPIAKGAAVYTRTGVGIELPLSPDDIDVEHLIGATLEEGNSNATFIVWENVNDAFGVSDAYINTENKGGERVTAGPSVINIRLKNPVANVLVQEFNPFIFVNGRGHEIHLVDHCPTKHMDMSLFGNEDDHSDVSKGIYYRMDNRFPWVLDFPRESAASPTWRYPLERASITDAYLNYGKWVDDQSNIDWFDSGKSGNVNEDLLY